MRPPSVNGEFVTPGIATLTVMPVTSVQTVVPTRANTTTLPLSFMPITPRLTGVGSMLPPAIVNVFDSPSDQPVMNAAPGFN